MPPGVPTVLICGTPAACVGDMVTCAGPPDTIAPPGCPTVMIGSGGGGGGGAGAGSGGLDVGQGDKSKSSEPPKGHFLDVRFVDKAGLPVGGVEYVIKDPTGAVTTGTLSGQLRKGGVPEGNHEIILKGITKAEWSVKSARVGDTVKLKAETSGIDDGEKGSFDIFIRESRFAHTLLKTIETTVQGDKVEAEWELQVDEKYLNLQRDKLQKGGYSSPTFYFVVKTPYGVRRSATLEYKDWIELEYKNAEGKPMANKEYKLFLPNGEVRKGKLDGNGYAKINNVPPGLIKVVVDPRK